MIRQIAFAIVSAIIFLQTANAQTPKERHEKIRNAVDKRDDKTAIAELQSFQKADAQLFTLNNFDYLLARLSEKTGDKATALANYHAIIQRQSILTQYALWHSAQISRNTGNLTLEREQLRQLLGLLFPDSNLRDVVYWRLCESLFESGDYKLAIESLKPISDTKVNASSRKAMLLLGQSYLKSNQTELAKDTFSKLINEMPNVGQPDDYALESAKTLDILQGGNETEAPQLADPEHLRRALIYQFNRDFAHARLHYGAIVTRYPESPNVPDALYQIGRGFGQERNYNDAIVPLQKVVQNYPDKYAARDAMNLLASCLGRLKRFDEAISFYKQVIEKFPDADNPERPYLNIIDTLRDAGRDQEALQWVDLTRTRFKGEMPAALALFSQLRIHTAQPDWEKVLSDYDLLKAEKDLGNLRVAGSTTQKEIALIRAYALEQLGKSDEAINAYLAIIDGRNEYHGWQATLRLQAMSLNKNHEQKIKTKLTQLSTDAEKAITNNEAERARVAATNAIRLTTKNDARKKFLDIIRRVYSQIPAYNNVPKGQSVELGRKQIITDKSEVEHLQDELFISYELLFLGLYDEGAPLFHAGMTKFKKTVDTNSGLQPETNFALAVIQKRGDHADKAVIYAEPLWRNVPADYVMELAPRESAELLYPIPYKESLLNHGKSKNVDPRLVLSIMRQESRYKPDIKSYAAARGLMQFISATANQIATQLNNKDFKQDSLYNPDTAIEFGSQYLSNLFQLFPQQPEAVASSYNGGEDNMARWMARSRSTENVRYVPEIVFAQSKDYVFKVLANYKVYQTLYDEKLENR